MHETFSCMIIGDVVFGKSGRVNPIAANVEIYGGTGNVARQHKCVEERSDEAIQAVESRQSWIASSLTNG